MTEPARTIYFEAGLQSLAAHGTFVDRPVEEGELAILHVLSDRHNRRFFTRDIECSAWGWRC